MRRSWYGVFAVGAVISSSWLVACGRGSNDEVIVEKDSGGANTSLTKLDTCRQALGKAGGPLEVRTKSLVCAWDESSKRRSWRPMDASIVLQGSNLTGKKSRASGVGGMRVVVPIDLKIHGELTAESKKELIASLQYSCLDKAQAIWARSQINVSTQVQMTGEGLANPKLQAHPYYSGINRNTLELQVVKEGELPELRMSMWPDSPGFHIFGDEKTKKDCEDKKSNVSNCRRTADAQINAPFCQEFTKYIGHLIGFSEASEKESVCGAISEELKAAAAGEKVVLLDAVEAHKENPLSPMHGYLGGLVPLAEKPQDKTPAKVEDPAKVDEVKESGTPAAEPILTPVLASRAIDPNAPAVLLSTANYFEAALFSQGELDRFAEQYCLSQDFKKIDRADKVPPAAVPPSEVPPAVPPTSELPTDTLAPSDSDSAMDVLKSIE